MKPDNIILEAVVGSTMYGLDTKDSDRDTLGVFVAPTSEVLKIGSIKESYVHTDPDHCYHEVGKYVRLLLKCNPTLTEVLWAEGYTKLTKQGKMLVDNRKIFLSESYVRNAYSGYVFSQAQKLVTRDGTYGNGRNTRYEKHSRHLFRLLLQGRELLEKGEITVRVSPENREALFAVGQLPVSELVTKFADEIKQFREIKSVLPKRPDVDAVNKLLLKIRKGNW